NSTKAEVDEQEDKVAHDKKLTGAENVNAGVQPEFESCLKKETGDNVKESENEAEGGRTTNKKSHSTPERVEE
ncbi:hypothetical protein A2U01_0064374, partial [Trifolium medium]|nr:hypothetical protein [Trifolium medium]